nr:PfkB family carbohydrate kinase [Brachyspira sp. G79]
MNNILSFGELLYDVYDNVSVIGGAPFNYSLQLSRLIGHDDRLRFITALGNDDYSKDALSFINNENIDKSLIQILDNYETGKATVFLNEKKVPDYIIHENAAWDNIEYNKDIENALNENYDLFYFNILSQRNEKSYTTLKKIFKNIKSKYKVCDVTFRKNYYTKEK